MSLLARAWIAAARARARLRPGDLHRDELIRRWAPGRTWADVGCMWDVDGRLAFLAEESGATQVTGLDVMAPTPRFEAEHARRSSAVRFVQGDVHDEAALAQVGVHDVVWSTGLIYHAPHPLLTLERLRSIAGELLVLGSMTIPEVPGLPQACVFYPGLDARARAVFRRAGGGNRLGITTPFAPEAGYGNWFWGLTPSALRALLATAGFELLEAREEPFNVLYVARPSAAAGP